MLGPVMEVFHPAQNRKIMDLFGKDWGKGDSSKTGGSPSVGAIRS